MQTEDVRKQLNDSSRAAIDMMASKALCSPGLRRILMEVALEEQAQVSSRASRVIESCIQMQPDILLEWEESMVKSLPVIRDPAVRRSFLKVFITHPLPENEELQGILMDCSFRYLNHPQEPIAVKAYCMDILYQFTGLYPEIANELILTLEGLVERDSSALCARGSVLLKYLRTMNPQ